MCRLCVQCEQETVLFDYGSGEFVCSECGGIEGRAPDSPSSFDDDVNGVTEIEVLAVNMELVAFIKERAVDLAMKMNNSGEVFDAKALAAATLYIACREDHRTRTLHEFASAARVSRSEVYQVQSSIVEVMGERFGEQIILAPHLAEEIAARWASVFGMNPLDMHASEEVARRTRVMLDIRRTYTSIAAASIYMISQLTCKTVTIDGLVGVSGVQESTIRDTYSDLYPHARSIIPDRFTNEVVATLNPTA